ncbi:MAG: hypothetical protein JNM68_03630 [Dinghuibacter sp.]|nr:hypothetical protein [Dinghuibacter sp.]
MIKYIPAKTLAAVSFILNMAGIAVAQTYNPVTVTGFNHDVGAETGTSS